MTPPVCPEHYKCIFTPPKSPPNYDVWWQGPWGVVAGLAVIVAVTIVLGMIVTYWAQGRAEARRERGRVREQEHKRLMAEQLTMQMDSAKGSPELLKIIREQSR